MATIPAKSCKPAHIGFQYDQVSCYNDGAADIAAGDIVSITSTVGGAIYVEQALDSGVGLIEDGSKLVAMHLIPMTEYGACAYRAVETELNTSGDTIGDAVYLSAASAGARTTTEPAGASVQVGYVSLVSATVGEYYLDPSMFDARTDAINVSVTDGNASLVATNVETALAELATPLTLTPGAEAGNAIPVVIAGPAHAAQYLAEVFDANMLQSLIGAITLAETGAGAEVSVTAKASLLFTTSAAGAATIAVTDVSGASTATFYLRITPAAASAGAKPGPSTIVAITFA